MLCQYLISKGLPTEDTDGCISHEVTGPMRDMAFWSRPNPENISASECGFGPFDDFTLLAGCGAFEQSASAADHDPPSPTLFMDRAGSAHRSLDGCIKEPRGRYASPHGAIIDCSLALAGAANHASANRWALRVLLTICLPLPLVLCACGLCMVA